MKVGDLVVYNLDALRDPRPPENLAIVVKDRGIKKGLGIRGFLIFYPRYNDYVNGWEDEYRIYSEGHE